MTTYVTPVLDPGMPELIETGANAHVLCVEVPLTDSEKRVLRYLPTQLTAPEIARQLFLSVHTVTTHIRHIYAKLGVHRRHEAVDRARARGLLAPIPGSISQPVPRVQLGRRVMTALWARRVLVIILSAMVIYTFVTQLGQ
jgi:DNA-binding CsgD family transcriptional regulator